MHLALSALLEEVATACRSASVATAAGLSGPAWSTRVKVRGSTAGWARPTPATCPAVEVEAYTGQTTQHTYDGEEVVQQVRVTAWAHRHQAADPLVRTQGILAACMAALRLRFGNAEGSDASEAPVLSAYVLGVSLVLSVRVSQVVPRA